MRQHPDLAKELAEKVVKDIRLQLHALSTQQGLAIAGEKSEHGL